jgi:hypothetical protein
VSSRHDRIRQAAALIAETISVVAAAIFLFLRAVLALVAALVPGGRAKARTGTAPAGPGGRG